MLPPPDVEKAGLRARRDEQSAAARLVSRARRPTALFRSSPAVHPVWRPVPESATGCCVCVLATAVTGCVMTPIWMSFSGRGSPGVGGAYASGVADFIPARTRFRGRVTLFRLRDPVPTFRNKRVSESLGGAATSADGPSPGFYVVGNVYRSGSMPIPRRHDLGLATALAGGVQRGALL